LFANPLVLPLYPLAADRDPTADEHASETGEDWKYDLEQQDTA
jgi:hypothetical protein